jgi:hypothetical protein
MGLYKNQLTAVDDMKRYGLFRQAGIVCSEQKHNLPSQKKFMAEHPRIFGKS